MGDAKLLNGACYRELLRAIGAGGDDEVWLLISQEIFIAVILALLFEGVSLPAAKPTQPKGAGTAPGRVKQGAQQAPGQGR